MPPVETVAGNWTACANAGTAFYEVQSTLLILLTQTFACQGRPERLLTRPVGVAA